MYGVCSETTPFSSDMFGCAREYEYIGFEGTIGKGGLDLHWSTKLNKESLTSIINALSSDTTGLSITLSLTAVNNAFETSEGAADGSTSTEWINLIGDKSNWSISLLNV